MTSTQDLIPAGTEVVATSVWTFEGQDYWTRSPATVLYFDPDTNSYALASGFRQFSAPAATVTPAS